MQARVVFQNRRLGDGKSYVIFFSFHFPSMLFCFPIVFYVAARFGPTISLRSPRGSFDGRHQASRAGVCVTGLAVPYLATAAAAPTTLRTHNPTNKYYSKMEVQEFSPRLRSVLDSCPALPTPGLVHTR